MRGDRTGGHRSLGRPLTTSVVFPNRECREKSAKENLSFVLRKIDLRSKPVRFRWFMLFDQDGIVLDQLHHRFGINLVAKDQSRGPRIQAAFAFKKITHRTRRLAQEFTKARPILICANFALDCPAQEFSDRLRNFRRFAVLFSECHALTLSKSQIGVHERSSPKRAFRLDFSSLVSIYYAR